MKQNQNKKQNVIVNAEGCATFDKLEDGRHIVDFYSYEPITVEPFGGRNCYVVVDGDGLISITELPKRIRNKALFRDDNSSLTLGRNKKYYFVFVCDEKEADKLPQKLVTQASAIAQKLLHMLIEKKGGMK